MKNCMFCGGSTEGKNRAKEHILSQDLLREFSLAKKSLEHSQFRIVDGMFSGGHVSVFPTTRSLSYSGFVAGQVCAACNNGWMNSLEVAVRPHLYPLMRGNGDPQHLTLNQRELLAAWYLKTTIALSQSIEALQFSVPLNHAKCLFQSAGKCLPENVAIFAAIADTSRFRWSLCPTWVVIAESGITKDGVVEQHADTYKVFMQLGKLLLLACHWPHDSVEYFMGDSNIVPLGGLALTARRSQTPNHLFSDESERFMMAIELLLKT